MGGSARILVVEDDADCRDSIVEQLAEQGYEVDAASNGAVALEKALIRRPDVVMFDFAMPVTDGPTLVDELRSLVTPMPVLVAISGLVAARQWCAENGVRIFLDKPFGESTLRRTAVSAVDLLTKFEPPPKSSRPSIHTACVVAVGAIEEDAVRGLLPRSLRQVRVVIVESIEEAEKMLDEIVPHVLIVEGTAAHARLRALATERGIPLLFRE